MDTIDLSYVEDIADGNEEFVQQLLGVLKKNLQEFPAKMQAEFAQADWHALRETAHKFKSCTAYMGVEKFNKLLLDIELSQENGIGAEELDAWVKTIQFYAKDLEKQVSQIMNLRKK